ncbi:MAG: c-type cytochrome [Terracidiphilus sp.]
MKTSSLSLPAAAVALLAAAVLAVAAVAQAPQTAPAQPPAAASPPQEHHYPDGTNLKVLPKTLTGDQLHEIMEGWAAALGTHCTTCHTADPTKIGPNGWPQLNFPDDSKPEKSTARLMVRMVQDINGNYISMVDNSGAPVACGTCHRGHLSPEPFVAPPKGPPPVPPSAGNAPPPPK